MAHWRSIIAGLGLLVVVCMATGAAASEYHGVITFGGLPLPGATIIASQESKKLSTISDQSGAYRFDDLSEGSWTIEISMPLFAPVKADVRVGPSMPAGSFELKLLPTDQLLAMANLAKAPPPGEPGSSSTGSAKPTKEAAGTQAPVDIPKPPAEQNSDSADGFLVNGSVNNAATSLYSLDRAFGNRRPNSRSPYNGGLGVTYGSSSLNARAYSLTGLEVPKPTYNTITGIATFGGPIKIPHLLAHGPNFVASYEWTRNQDEQEETGLVPSGAERAGDLAGLTNSLGQPITVFNPSTGAAFLNNQVPVSGQAAALLQLYPAANIAGNPLYNFQAPVIDDSHEDALQTRLEKAIGHRDDLYGQFSFQSNRADNVSLFGFVDDTNTLGLDGRINWSHRFSTHLFLTSGFEFSRLRTSVGSEFANRQNISGAAGIEGNDQDPAEWGPPSLNFSSGIASLTDANTSFDRNRTDRVTASLALYRRRHNITIGGEYRKQEYNDFYQRNPRGAFTFTGAATASVSSGSTGSDLADFLIGIPDTSSLAFGNADKYFRQPVYALYAQDDWRVAPSLTFMIGGRWEYGAPMTELKGRLVNLDVTPGFADVAPVLASNSVGSLTGNHYPSSLIRPDKLGFEPRIGLSWRPIPASTVVIRAGYGVYHDTSVYLSSAQQLAQQAPLSTALNVENSAACPLTLANGFSPCSAVSGDTYAVDPNFRVGYAQTWRLSVQRDMPAALQLTATYLGVKGTRGVQEFLPNTFPPGAANPCASCPLGFEYRTSGGNSTRESGELQLRRRLRGGFMAALDYFYSKSTDDDAFLGGEGHVETGSPTEAAAQSAAPAAQTGAIAQNWLDLRAERALSTFDQRHLLSVKAQYTSGQGLEGGTLMGGWPGRLLKEWTVLANLSAGTGMPETPIYLEAVPGTGFTGTIRPSVTGSPIAVSRGRVHLNAAAYMAPSAGTWGDAPRDSITGPAQLSLDSSLERTFRPTSKLNLTARVDATNVLNHAAYSGWITTINSTQFGLPASVNAMRSLQTSVRLKF
jgi:hypothetical protein